MALIARQRCRFRTVRLLEEPHRPARRSIKFNVSQQNPVLCALCLQNKHCFLILFAKHWVDWCLCVCVFEKGWKWSYPSQIYSHIRTGNGCFLLVTLSVRRFECLYQFATSNDDAVRWRTVLSAAITLPRSHPFLRPYGHKE